MAVRTILASVAAGVLLVLPAGASGGKDPPLRVTFVGDSVPAALTYVGGARELLRDGLTVRLDLKVCRRLVAASCRHGGAAPTTALQAVRRYGPSLGGVLIVDVGYNEDGKGYAAGIDEIMRAALAQGARGVVWVTLREADPVYRGTNAAIADAARRWPELHVADWDAFSRGKPWFRKDGLHLTPTGAGKLAAFVRARVLEAARGTDG